MLGTTELLIILAVVVLLFGARKLPELARSVGESLGEFRKATADADADAEDGDDRASSVDDDA